MLETQAPQKGLLFFSILYRSDLFSPEVLAQKLEALFGLSFSFSPEYNPLADYYAKEMGDASLLKRLFIVPSCPQTKESLLSVKLLSLEWEREWAKNLKRMVNVDVGFISAENFLLATTKNYSHRVYIGQNIFADLTYQWTDGAFHSFPWTYPDYKDSFKIDFLTWCRSYLLTLSRA